MKVLVIDVGGSHIKLQMAGQEQPTKLDSGPDLTAQQLVDGVLRVTAGWEYDHVSIGYPGPVSDNRILEEPVNLGPGWMGFDFEAALQRPVRIINDAAMQALGSYDGGKMLFLGLGTGLGSTMIVNGIVIPMELGHLPYKKATFEDYVGKQGQKEMGRRKWQACVFDVVERLRAALLPEVIVLGGGNVRKLTELPLGCRAGSNANAFLGGIQLWERDSDHILTNCAAAPAVPSDT